MRNKTGIYKITNQKNGKVYIGQAKNIRIRWNNHKYNYKDKNNNKILYRAMRKHGIKNFSFEVILECEEWELDEWEIYFIEIYKSYIHAENSNGYNMTRGGDTTRGWVMPKEVKDKISKKATGRIKTKEEVEKIKDSRRTKPIVQLDIYGNYIKTYRSSCDILRENNFIKTISTIRQCCKKSNPNRRTAYGYIWMYEEEYINYNGDYSWYNSNKKESKKKTVYQYTLEYKLLNTFESIREAGKLTGLKHQNISNCANGKQKTCGGYIWSFDLYNDKD